jgi:hypothetical protein
VPPPVAQPAPAPAAPARPIEDVITGTQFGPYRAGEPVTRQKLEQLFARKFEATEIGEIEGWVEGSGKKAWQVIEPAPSDAVTDQAVNLGEPGDSLKVLADGSKWTTWSRTLFRDQHGLRPGVSSAKLVATIADLKCTYLDDEEPMFACWSKATPELRYVGHHSRTLDENFSKQDLATSNLHVEWFEWRPKKKKPKPN